MSKKPRILTARESEPKCCDDYEVLTFDKFIKVSVSGDLSALIISGVPNQHQLFLSWIKIQSDYYTLINSKEHLRQVKLAAKMEALNLKINFVTEICGVLQSWYDVRLVKCLQNFGYSYEYAPETYLKDIDRTLIELQNDNFKLQLAKNEYEKEQNRPGKSHEKPTKNSFMKDLYAIEKYRQQRYPPDKLTVYEFGMFRNELVEYSEAMREQTERNTRK